MESLTLDQLPAGEVLVAVEFSSLNFKDALALTGRGKIARRYPLVPGIDLAGTVMESAVPGYRPGDRVLVNGWEIGELHWGGLAERARLQAEWLVPVPAEFDTREVMAIGTAGFTAMLAVMALEDAGLDPGADLPVLVTGASGGLGSLAVALLARRGYRVAAATGRPENADFLRELGAAAIVPREELDRPARPLETQRWAAVIDAVGGRTLARALAETGYGGSVAACGLAGGSELQTTVMPFILRAVNLLGINSVLCPLPRRLAAWDRLARELSPALLAKTTTVVGLEEVSRLAEEMLAGRVRGRVVVDVQA